MTGPRARTDAVLWRQLDGPGMEQCRSTETGLSGVVVVWAGTAWRLDYEVRCDDRWRTREVVVQAYAGEVARNTRLQVDERGSWLIDGDARPDLQGCVDVDLGFSPSTNTLPIRRLGLHVRESATIDAAWMEFPSLAVRRVPQRYTRLDERTYRYENLPTGFSAEMTVDEGGLVVSYPPGWERVAGSSTESPLFAPSPTAGPGDRAALYDGLIGSWHVDVLDYEEDGSRRTSVGEWHFGWALEGRAVQDVFIVPARGERDDLSAWPKGNRYGTTIRFYDPARQAWRIVWINPVTGAFNTLLAHRQGDAIVQEGVNDGMLMRWTFAAVERDRFHWVGEESTDGGNTWHTRAEFFARRTSFAPLR